jgi:hypothetical protein
VRTGIDRTRRDDGRVRRLPHVVPLFLAALLVLAGCADDAEPSAEAPPAPSAEPTVTEVPSPEPTAEPTVSETPSPVPTETLEPTETPELTEEPTPDAPPEPTEPAEPEPTTPPVDLSVPPTTYAEALAHFDARGQEAQEVRRFQTAAGTYCRLGGTTLVSCELPPGGIPDPDYCGDGPAQNVGRVALPRSGAARAECNSDTIREGNPPATLPEGTVGGSEAAGVLCLVERIGVTCVDPAQARGFFLGAQEYHVFRG